MIVHLNGQLIPAEHARISVFDRGFIFGDGVYEGLRAHRSTVIGLDRHAARMQNCLAEARIRGFDAAELGPLTAALLDANRLTEGAVYWQVTRGAPPPGAPVRARLPHPGARPTVFGYAAPYKPVGEYVVPEPRTVAVRPDTRWTRGRLKSTSLLGGVLAAIEAHEQGADDAILVRDGLVTEGTATNVFLSMRGRLITPALDSAPMLEGVTRALLMEADPSIVERPVTLDDLLGADEVMLVGTYTMVVSVVQIDGRPVGGAAGRAMHAGPDATALLAALRRAIEKDVDSQHARLGTQPAGHLRR